MERSLKRKFTSKHRQIVGEEEQLRRYERKVAEYTVHRGGDVRALERGGCARARACAGKRGACAGAGAGAGAWDREQPSSGAFRAPSCF